MKYQVLSVGKPRDKVLAELFSRYETRLRRMVDVETAQVAEFSGGGLKAEEVRRREADRLRAHLGKAKQGRRTLVALDEHGATPDTRELARILEEQQERGVQTMTFAVGGHHGLDPSFVREADMSVALSRLTFTHELARVLLVEQLYRARALLAGHPYHRG